MSWSAPKTWIAGAVLPASELNTHLRDQLLELRGGGLSLPSQAADDFIYADTDDQLGRLAAESGSPFYNGSAWVIKRDVREDLTIAANVLTVDLATKDWFRFTRDANITTMTINNIPATGRYVSFVLDVVGNGSSFTWAWFTATVKWPNGIVPSITTTNGKMDRYIFATYDNGTTWFGSVVGQVYL